MKYLWAFWIPKNKNDSRCPHCNPWSRVVSWGHMARWRYCLQISNDTGWCTSPVVTHFRHAVPLLEATGPQFGAGIGGSVATQSSRGCCMSSFDIIGWFGYLIFWIWLAFLRSRNQVAFPHLATFGVLLYHVDGIVGCPIWHSERKNPGYSKKHIKWFRPNRFQNILALNRLGSPLHVTSSGSLDLFHTSSAYTLISRAHHFHQLILSNRIFLLECFYAFPNWSIFPVEPLACKLFYWTQLFLALARLLFGGGSKLLFMAGGGLFTSHLPFCLPISRLPIASVE